MPRSHSGSRSAVGLEDSTHPTGTYEKRLRPQLGQSVRERSRRSVSPIEPVPGGPVNPPPARDRGPIPLVPPDWRPPKPRLATIVPPELVLSTLTRRQPDAARWVSTLPVTEAWRLPLAAGFGLLGACCFGPRSPPELLLDWPRLGVWLVDRVPGWGDPGSRKMCAPCT